MNEPHIGSAFGSEENVKAVADKLIFLSGKVHDALRRLPPNNAERTLLTPYALLTEEYALRFRANILFNDAARFVILDFDTSHDELITSLSDVETRLSAITTLDELSDLLSGLTLFSNSIITRKTHVISLLFQNLIGSTTP